MAWPVTSLAQTATGSAVPELAASDTLGHAAAKGVTLKVINGVVALTVFGTGTGSLVAGGVLAAAVAASSFTVFVANDYIWDRFFPNTNLAANNQSFNAVWSVGRNTGQVSYVQAGCRGGRLVGNLFVYWLVGFDPDDGSGVFGPFTTDLLRQQRRLGLVRLVEHARHGG